MTRRDLATAALVAVGGMVGASARYAIDLLVPWESPSFPWATFTVNLVGSLAIWALLVVVVEGPPSPWWTRPLLAVGLVGGFTTFSAVALETVVLLDEGAVPQAAGYVAVTLCVGMVAVWLAAVTTRRVVVGRGGQL